MPTTHKPGNQKQKNRPFKGSKSKKTQFKVGVTKKITKQIDKPATKETRKLQKAQQKQHKQQVQFEQKNTLIQKNKYLNEIQKEYLGKVLQEAKSSKIVVIIPMNQDADAFRIKNKLQEIFKGSLMEDFQQNEQLQSKLSFNFPYLKFQTNQKIFPELQKEQYNIIACPNNDYENCLDFCKVADIICPLFSSRQCNIEQLAIDPFANANAFDENSYRFLSQLRVQGMPSVLGIVQDLELITQQNKQNQVKKFYQRFFGSEFGNENKFIQIDENNKDHYIQLLRMLQGTPIQRLTWRDNRVYLLAEQVHFDQSTGLTEIIGFCKGTTGLNANQLIHITGYDDYQIEKIEILKNPFKIEHKKNLQDQQYDIQIKDDDVFSFKNASNNEFYQDKNVLFSQNADPNLQESLQALVESQGHQDINLNNPNSQKKQIILNRINDNNNILDDLEEEKIDNQLNQGQKQMEDETEIQQGDMEMDDEDINDDQDSDVSFQDQSFMTMNQHAEKQKIKFTIEQRAPDDLEFEDEVDYPADINLRERYKKYVGLKNFKTSDWVIQDDYPDEYEKIYIYDNFRRTQKLAIKQSLEDTFVYDGLYVKIYVKNFNVNAHSPHRPLIISSLYKHERKVTLIHFKVKKNIEYPDQQLKSKTNYKFHVGFRKFVANPVFSAMSSNCNKTKYRKVIKDNHYNQCSFYYLTMFPPQNALIFEIQENENNVLPIQKMIASGEFVKNDPMQVNLKRIILTGYPFKIHKKRAVIRMMFFNKYDIQYFQPVQITTKHGLKGNITQSVGTHGYMKCSFNQQPKQHDTICMYLYKRQFPKWIY